jgi:hypothetical protein
VTQYINLFNPAFQPRRELLSAATLAATLAAVCAVIAAGHFVAKHRVDALQPQVAESEAQLVAERAKLAAIGVASAAGPDAATVAEIEKLRTALQARESALAELASGSLGDTTGFSGQFRAFARQTMPGVWLTAFRVSGAGRDIVIEGRSLAAEHVPTYIRRLNAEPVFKGKAFASLVIEEGKSVAPPAAPNVASRPVAKVPAPYVEFRLVSTTVREDVRGSAAPAAPARGERTR